MDNFSIIEKNTYEIFKHEEDCPFAFISDKAIAPSISELNKKGYETLASCSGHYKNEFYEWFNEDIKKLNEYENNDKVIIKEIRDDSFDYWTIVDTTTTYILFNKHYDFDNLPDGFEYYSLDDDRTCIQSEINYYDEFNNRKKRQVVEEEIEKNCIKLLEWVKQLPNMKGMIKYE